MIDTTNSQAQVLDQDTDRVLGFTVYALYILSLFVWFVPALVGVILAYARGADSALPVRSHFKFQQNLFWISAGLGLLGMLLVFGALGLGLSSIVEARGLEDGWDAWTIAGLDDGELRFDPAAGWLVLAAVLALTVGWIWMLVGSIFGLARLASGAAVGQARR